MAGPKRKKGLKKNIKNFFLFSEYIFVKKNNPEIAR
jgi:hypothetical protein